MADTTTPPEQPTVAKRNDAYTGLLAISFLAMVGGTVLLYLEYQNYEGKAPPPSPKIDVPGVQQKAAPNTGGPAPVVVPKAPMEEMPPKDPKEAPPAMMRVPSGEQPSTVKIIETASVQIPVVAPVSAIVPAAVIEPATTPIIDLVEPTVGDAPPVPTGRFNPVR